MQVSGVRGLLAKGVFDSAIQFAATAGVRFILIASVPVMAAFLGPEDVARFDLFVVGANFFLILISVGVDSGLAVVSSMPSRIRRRAYLTSSIVIVIVAGLIILAGLLTAFSRTGSGTSSLRPEEIALVFAYSLANALMLVVFSYYRWLSKALTASILVVVGNGVGMVVGYFSLYNFGSLLGLMEGLAAGSILGAIMCLYYVKHDRQLINFSRAMHYFTKITLTLLSTSWPFLVASLLLLSRRFVDRGILVAFASMTLLGGYATVSRTGELIAFALAVPAIGLSPLVLAHALEERGRGLARLLYTSYVAISALITIASYAVWHLYGANLFPEAAAPIAPIFLAAIVGSLLFGQTTVAGYGYILKKNTKQVAYLATMFIGLYGLIAVPFVVKGHLTGAVGVGFVVSSLVYGAVFVYCSEKKVCMGYPQWKILLANSSMAAVAIAAIFTAT